jgi:hypothetical protein
MISVFESVADYIVTTSDFDHLHTYISIHACQSTSSSKINAYNGKQGIVRLAIRNEESLTEGIS